MKKIVIAIDGYVATGKGTISKLIAEKYNLLHIDTGAFYRAIALETLLKPNYNIEKIIDNIDLKWDNGKIYLSGEDVTEEIRKQDVTDRIDRICNLPIIREYVTLLSRNIASNNSVIMDGRDIGNNILPKADLKFLLVAKQEVRINRRLEQNIKKGIKTSLKTVTEDVIFRDKRDKANMGENIDRIVIDNTYLTVEETIDQISKYIDDYIEGKYVRI